MGRPSSIKGRPVQKLVDDLIDRGASLEEIRTRTGVSLSAAARYRQYRKSTMAKMIDGEPNVVDLVRRLLDAADAARAARRAADLLGSPAAVSRAIATESSLLTKLIDGLSVDDASVEEAFAEIDGMLGALRRLVIDDPDTARGLSAHLIKTPATRDVGIALEQALGRAS